MLRTPPDRFAPSLLRLTLGALVVIAIFSLKPWPVAAQQGPPRPPAGALAKKKPPAAKSARPRGARRPLPPVAREEQPAPDFSADLETSAINLRPFLTGDEWQDTLLRFEQWLSVQSLYDEEQVEQMRTKFAQSVKRVTAEDRKQFIKDVDAKLQVLYSPGTAVLQENLEECLPVASAAYIKKTRQQLPDVVGSTPDELQERLARFALRYQSMADVHQKFDQMRQLHVASDSARSNAPRFNPGRPSGGQFASSSNGGNGRPAKGFAQARDYYPPSGTSITYSVIPAMPIITNYGVFGFGGGVAVNIQRNR